MKILWVKAGKLLPVDTGGKIRSFNILRHLAREHEVTLLSYYGGLAIRTMKRRSLSDCPEPTPSIPLHPRHARPVSGLYSSAAVGRSLCSKQVCASPGSSGSRTALGDRSLDVAVCDFLSASLNFADDSPAPVVLFQHNVETMLWRRMADTENLPCASSPTALKPGRCRLTNPEPCDSFSMSSRFRP